MSLSGDHGKNLEKISDWGHQSDLKKIRAQGGLVQDFIG